MATYSCYNYYTFNEYYETAVWSCERCKNSYTGQRYNQQKGKDGNPATTALYDQSSLTLNPEGLRRIKSESDTPANPFLMTGLRTISFEDILGRQVCNCIERNVGVTKIKVA